MSRSQTTIPPSTGRRVRLHRHAEQYADRGNTAAGNPDDCSGNFSSLGHNLIGHIANSATCLIHATGSAPDFLNLAAGLGGLADNGGVTQTVGLLASSPAVDEGSPLPPGSDPSACLLFDQRGYARPLGAACDIGAFERSRTAGLSRVIPDTAGNSGITLLTVAGNGFVSGATIELEKSGQTDLIASDVTVDPAGSSAATFFDLSGVALGAWDLVLTNPDKTTLTLPGALTIEQPRAAVPWALLSGPRLIRPEVPATYTVLYGNSGNVEADAVPLQISVPAAFGIEFPTISTPPQQAGQASTDWTKSGFDAHVEQAGALRTFMFLAPAIPAGSQLTFTFRLIPHGVGEGDHILLNAEVGAPYYTGASVDVDTLDSIVSGARTYAQTALGGTISPTLLPQMKSYAANQLALEIAAGRSTLASALSGSATIYALPQNLQDIAEYGIVASGGTLSHSVSREAERWEPSSKLETLPQSNSGNPFYAVTPRCSGTVLAEGTSCTDPYNPPPTPKDPLLCLLLAASSISTQSGECSPKPRKGCPSDSNCEGPSPSVSVDPNGKYGQMGRGTQQYLTSGYPLQYLITFENEPTASAPAATVTVIDQLDTANMDLSTFQFGPIGFGNFKLSPPPSITNFHGALDLRPAQNVLVDVNASLDARTGALQWSFTSLDPMTQAPITSATDGFLPPDATPPEGDGYVTYTLYPKSPADGKTVCNQASIVFDTNAAIETENWCNTYDDSAPVSSVSALPSTEGPGSFNVSWSGTDVGSGVASYSIYVSDNGGHFTAWQRGLTATTASYTGKAGHTYGFYSIAADVEGNVEAAKTTAEATTEINGGTVPRITAISPDYGAPAAFIEVTGSNFGASQGKGSVIVGDAFAQVTAWSNTAITVRVPSRADTGNVTVTTSGETSNGAAFTFYGEPSIISLSVNSGLVGTSVTINGSNLLDGRNNATVAFNGTPATISSETATQIQVTVPSGSTSGPIRVRVNGVAVVSPTTFTVTRTVPQIMGIGPNYGAPAAFINITGSNFGITQGNNGFVIVGDAFAQVTAWSDTAITIRVPSRASTGNLVVGVGRESSNGAAFTFYAEPSITNLSSGSEPVGDLVTITGNNLLDGGNNATVTFNGTPAVISSDTSGRIQVVVPTGATSGRMLVRVNGVALIGTTNFSVVPPPP